MLPGRSLGRRGFLRGLGGAPAGGLAEAPREGRLHLKRIILALTAGLLAACGTAETPTEVGPAADAGAAPDTPELDLPCDAELARFDVEVNRPILVRKCAPCHASTGPAKDSQLVLQNDDGATSDNWRAAAALGLEKHEGVSVLLLRASDRHPRAHPGGAVAPIGSADYLTLEAFSADAADPACNADVEPEPEACENPAYGPRLLRRLSHAEYDASLEDLLGRTSTRSASLAVDPLVGGFDNHASTLVVQGLLADQLRRNAEDVAAQIVDEVERHLPCTPTPETADACRDLFIRDFVTRVYRRPVTDEEHGRYVAVFDATSRGEFSRGVRWVVTAALQSPHFLYRSELGEPAEDGSYRLTGYEIASALSFFLTGRPPDRILTDLAATDRLQDPDARAQQARRLLATPAGQRHMARFFDVWLALDRIHTVPKDLGTYPALTESLRRSMAGETERFVRWVLLREGGTLTALLTAPYSFLNPTLESHYDEVAFGEPDAEGFRRSEQPGRRFGLLTQGSLLAVHSKPNEASPVHRGKLVRERLLCEPLAPPPPGVAVEPPPIDPNLTTRERYAAHSAVEPCRSCHRLIDPIGFGFGNYDGVGRYQTEEAGQPIEAYGEIVDSPATDGRFEDLAGLAALLAGSPDVHACFSRRWQRWAYGLEAEGGLACALQHAHEAFEASGLRVDALLVALAASEHLQTRRGD